MMAKNQNELKVFGYGLTLFIPFIVMMHSRQHGLSAWGFFFVIIGLLYVLDKVNQWRWLYFLVLFSIWAMIVFGKSKHYLGITSIAFLAVSVSTLIIVIYNVVLLAPIYRGWMKVSQLINTIITTVVLTILFYFVFGIVGLILRLLHKDLLNRALDHKAVTYWGKRDIKFNSETYKRQF